LLSQIPVRSLALAHPLKNGFRLPARQVGLLLSRLPRIAGRRILLPFSTLPRLLLLVLPALIGGLLFRQRLGDFFQQPERLPLFGQRLRSVFRRQTLSRFASQPLDGGR
jgi:hypothetical protein